MDKTMLKVEILGASCFNCVWLEHSVAEVLEDTLLHTAYELVKVSDMQTIADYGVLRLPALVINGRVLCQGRLPTIEQITRWIGETRPANP